MANGLVDARGFKLVADVPGAGARGEALVQQREDTRQKGLTTQILEGQVSQIPQQAEAAGLQLQGRKEQAAVDTETRTAQAMIQGAGILKTIQSPEAKLNFLEEQRTRFESAGLSTQPIDQAIQFARAGDFESLAANTDKLIALGQPAQAPAKPFTLSPGQTRFTPEGKAITTGGEDPVAKAKLLDQNVKAQKTRFDQAAKIRAEILKESVEFNKTIDAFDRIKSSTLDPSPAGDIALIFNFMKMLDPGSVVREGEFATAQNAAGVPDRIRNVANKILEGERLNPKQRKDFTNQAENIFKTAKRRNDKTVDSFIEIAKRNKIPRADIFVERGGALDAEAPADAPQAQAQPQDQLAPQEGATATNQQTGEQLRFTNGQWQPI